MSYLLSWSRKAGSCSKRREEIDWSLEKLGSIRSASWSLYGTGYLAKPISLIANLVLQDAVERIFVQNLYADIPRGIYLVRGENVLVLGEIV